MAIQAMDPSKPIFPTSQKTVQSFSSLQKICFIIAGLLASVTLCGAIISSSDYIEQGESAYEAGDYDVAISAYLNAIAIDPSGAEAWNYLGLAYFREEQYTVAETALRRAVTLEPDYSQAWNNLGDLYTKTGRYAEAKEAYQNAVPFPTTNRLNWPTPDRQWNEPERQLIPPDMQNMPPGQFGQNGPGMNMNRGLFFGR